MSRDVVFDEKTSRDAIVPDPAVEPQKGDPDDDPSADYTPPEISTSSDSSNIDNNEHILDVTKQSTPDTSAVPDTDNLGLQRATSVRNKPAAWRNTAILMRFSPESPLSFNAATKGEDAEKWPAIQSEIDSIRKNSTWILVLRT